MLLFFKNNITSLYTALNHSHVCCAGMVCYVIESMVTHVASSHYERGPNRHREAARPYQHHHDSRTPHLGFLSPESKPAISCGNSHSLDKATLPIVRIRSR
jgi:hypothetical protein